MKTASILLACLALAACSNPPATPEADPPEPQAASGGQHTELRDAMQAPLDKARAVEQTQDERNEARDEVLGDAEG